MRDSTRLDGPPAPQPWSRVKLYRFHEELWALWARAGKADAWTLGKRTGLPSARFEFLFRPHADKVLPDWLDVQALLIAAKEPVQAHKAWEARWNFLDNLIRGGDQPADRMPEPHETSAIEKLANVALEARDPTVFVTQLERLRQLQGKSFAAIAQASKTTIPLKDNRSRVEQLARSTAHRMVQPGNFPASAQHVRMFVQACGVTSEEIVEKWVQAYVRAAQRRQAQSVFEKTKAHHANSDQASILEQVVDRLTTEGAYSEAIRMLKTAYREERSRRLALERNQALTRAVRDVGQLRRAPHGFTEEVAEGA